MLFKNKHICTRFAALVLVLCMVLTFMPVVHVSATEDSVLDKSVYDRDNKVDTQADGTNALQSGYIRNTYIEAYINSDGHYTFGTVEGDPNSDTDNHKLLLYGHPDSSTTETLIRIDGSDYFFDEFVTDIRFNSEGTQCVATATIDGVQVQQILTLSTNPYTNIEDQISIRYTYRNTTSRAKQIGVRIMLDTMLGDNDGAPFRVNGQDVTKEVEFLGNNVPQYWQSFDSLSSPNVTASGFFYFAEGEKPDKVQFAAWPEIHGSSWNFAVNSGRYVTSDSAVAAYFNPRTVAAGGSYSVVTYYGISGFSSGNSDLDGEIAVRITAPSELTGSDVTSGYLNNPFDVSAYVTNQGATTLENVRAVLDLSNAPQLSLDSSQPSTIQLGNLTAGYNSAIQWTLRAQPQTVDTDVSYSITFYSGNTHLKTMDVALRLCALREEEIYCTVSFDLNGASGTAPASQRVPIGSYATQPANPQRSGYIFDGWYANAGCTGSKWFNSYNMYRGDVVTQNITLYAKWIQDEGLVYGTDTFNFENTDADFFSYYDYSHNYMLTGDYYDILLENTASSERQSMLRLMRSEWAGSCFGMSCVLALVRAGALDVDYFQADADVLYDLDAPSDSETIFNLVNYYMIMQMSNRTANARNDYNATVETSNNRAIINALDESAYPVVVGFNINRRSTGTRLGGHAVVAYKYTQDSDGYDVYIWDPNDKTEPVILYISNDFTTSYFVDSSYDNSTYSSYMKYALTVEDGHYDYKNIQQELMSIGHSSGAGANAINANESDPLVLLTNYADFTITASNGSYAVVENGMVTAGDLEIGHAEYLNELGTELLLQFIISEDEACAYTVVPENAVSVVTGDYLAYYTTSLVCNDELDGFYASIMAETSGEVIFGVDGTVETAFDSAAQKRIEVVANDSNTDWDCVAVVTTSNLTVTPDSEGTRISAQEDADVYVGASDGYNTVEFDGVSLAANEDLELTEDDQNPGTAILGDQTAVLGHSVVFFTKGGSPITAQTDIPNGDYAYSVEDPVREGFVFAGWYTTEDCTDGSEWDFESPVMEDMKVYAKWLTDVNYLHTITFKTLGHDDVVIIVRNGQSLSEEELPAVPEKEGFLGAWDIDDFSNITADMVVNAIYTSNILADSTGDGNVNTLDALFILQYYIGVIDDRFLNIRLSDLDGNGSVDPMDALLVLQYYIGIINKFPIES